MGRRKAGSASKLQIQEFLKFRKKKTEVKGSRTKVEFKSIKSAGG